MCFSSPSGVGSCFDLNPRTIKAPTRINVRIFDHLGHFISQYQKHITKEMLEASLGKNSQNLQCADFEGKQHPVYGETGVALIGMRMYPVSQSGRVLGTGPYVFQITTVTEEYGTCTVSGGSPQWTPSTYGRTYEVQRKGYRRQ